MGRAGLAPLARFIARRPVLVLVLGALLTLVAGGFAALELGVKTRRGELVDPDIEFQRLNIAVEKEHGDLDVILAAIKGRDRAETLSYARRLGEALDAQQQAFRSVFYRVDPAAFGDKALLFARLDQLDQLSGFIERALPGLENGALPGALLAFAAELEARMSSGDAPNDGAADMLGEALSGFLSELERAARNEAVTPGPLMAASEERGVSWAGDGETLIMLVLPQIGGGDLDPRRMAVMALRAEINALSKDFPEVAVGLTGKPVLNVDEIETYTVDSFKATIIALVGVTLLVMLALRRLVAPLLVGLCLAMAIVSTLGAAAIWPGHLNLLSVVFVVIIIGLGVDFGLHLIARYDEERALDKSVEEAIERAMTYTGSATVAGAVTTAVAFLATVFTDFRGLKELGVIAGCGVLLALVLMLTVLPALVIIADGRLRRSRQAWAVSRWGTALARATDQWNLRHSALMLALSVLVLALALLVHRRVAFNGNLLELQDPSLPSVQLELRLLEDQKLSSWFICVSSHDSRRLRDLVPRLEALASVRKTEGLHSILPAEQEAKTALLGRLAERIRSWLARTETPPLRAAALSAALDAASAAIEQAEELAFKAGRGAAVERLDQMLTRLEAVADSVTRSGLNAALVAYDEGLEEKLMGRLGDLVRAGAAASPMGPDDLPAVLRERFIGRTGAELLRIYPRANVWDSDASRDFIAEVRSIAPDVTGVPILIQESSRLMVGSYRDAALYALVVITLFLIAYFRRIVSVLLALLSLFVGAAWLVLFMALFGIELNPGNLIALPLLLGIGIDYSVHVVHRWQEQGRLGEEAPRLVATSMGRAVIYSALTSAVGFGSLMIARHRGTASIGITIALGLLCCLLASLSFLPAVLNLIQRMRKSHGQ